MNLKRIGHLLKETYVQWSGNNTSLLGAALAYYAIFALAPLAVVAVVIAGFIFGEQAARGELVAQLQTTVGPAVAGALQQLIQTVHRESAGVLASIVSGVVLLLGATTLFNQLQGALNTIWGVMARPGRGWLDVVRERLFSFLAVVGVGALLLLSLVLNTLLSALAAYLPSGEGGAAGLVLWRVVSGLVSLGLITLLFAMIYKVLPDVQIAWGDVWTGAAITAVLFLAGNMLIGLYLGRTTAASAYGAAGSLVIILLWVYYSSQVLLFGAELTQVYAREHGRTLLPTANAIPIPTTVAESLRKGDNTRAAE
jgi:membrane protein